MNNSSMKNVKVVKHPIVQELITQLRDVNTNSHLFRIYSKQLATFLLYEALVEVDTKERKVKTQTGLEYKGVEFSKETAFVCILRAAMGMLFTAMEVFPSGEFHAVGVKRNEDDPFNVKLNFYLDRMNEISKKVNRIVVMDPMLATGSSALTVLEGLRKVHKFEGKIQFVCYIAAKPGAEVIAKQFPDVKITCAGLDEKLNDKAFIIPGLGDAGDRFFGIETNLGTIR